MIGGGTVQFVSGGLTGVTQPFGVDIRAGSSGEDPVGTLTLLVTFTDPSCLKIGGSVEEPPTATINVLNPITGRRAVFQLGSVGGVQFVAGRVTDSPDDCVLGTPVDVAQVISGQISIADAPALPISAGDCRDGGWKGYDARFTNQGQCVAFVKRGPKP